MRNPVIPSHDEWQSVRFDEVARNMTRMPGEPGDVGIERFVGLEHLDGGDLRVRRWGLVADGTTFTKAFEPGEVLFGKRRAYQRKAAIADFGGVCSGDLLVFAAGDTRLLPELLPLVVTTEAFVQRALSTSAGSLSPRTRWKDLAEFEFSLPPAAVQRRVAALTSAALNEADAFMVASEKASMVARVGLAEGLAANAAWPTIRLADVLLGSPESGCSAPESPRRTGHFVLGLQAMSRDGYLPGQFKSVEPTPEMLKARLHRGDLLVTRSNTLDRVGFAAIYNEHRDDVSFPDTMMRLSPDEAEVRAEFLVALLMSPLGRKHLTRVAAGTSASMKKINRKSLGSFEFPLPSLAAQQRLLAEYERGLDAATALRDAATRARELVTGLRQRSSAHDLHRAEHR